MFSIERATYIYWPIHSFARVGVICVVSVEGATYNYRPIDGFAKVGFVMVF
jgi:hypothetical protein